MILPKVLVTGANGFLGNHIVRVLYNRGYRVKVFVRTQSDIEILKGLQCDVYRGNLNDESDIQEAIFDCSYVIHCAALTSPLISNFEEYKKANLSSTQALVEVCKKNSIKRFVFVSTANAFTNGTMEKPGSENSNFMPWLKASGYAYSKYLAQEFLLEQNKKNGFPVIVVAPSFLIGPIDPKPSSGALILYILKNKWLFYPAAGKSFVDVRAAAIATVNALKLGETGECYLLTGENLSYRHFYKMVASHSPQKKRFLKLPKSVLFFFKIFRRIVPHRKIELLAVNAQIVMLDNYFSSEKAKRVLKMPETDLTPLLAETITWFRQNGYVKRE